VLEVEFWEGRPDGQVVTSTDWRSEGTRMSPPSSQDGAVVNSIRGDRGRPAPRRGASHGMGTAYRQMVQRVQMQDGEYRPITVMGLRSIQPESEPPLWAAWRRCNPQIRALNPAAETPSTERPDPIAAGCACGAGLSGWVSDGTVPNSKRLGCRRCGGSKSDASKSSQ